MKIFIKLYNISNYNKLIRNQYNQYHQYHQYQKYNTYFNNKISQTIILLCSIQCVRKINKYIN